MKKSNLNNATSLIIDIGLKSLIKCYTKNKIKNTLNLIEKSEGVYNVIPSSSNEGIYICVNPSSISIEDNTISVTLNEKITFLFNQGNYNNKILIGRENIESTN